MCAQEFCWTKTIFSVTPGQPVAQPVHWCTKLEWKYDGNPIKKNHTYKQKDSKFFFFFLTDLTLLAGTKHKSILCLFKTVGRIYLGFT